MVWQVPAGVAAVTVDSVVYPWSELVRSTGQTWSPLGTLLSLTSCRDSENTHKRHINWRKLHSAAGVSWFIVISRDLTLSRASLCAPVARLSEGLCVCVFDWFESEKQEEQKGGIERMHGNELQLSAPYNRLLLWFRGSRHRKISKRKRAFLILVIVHGLSSMVPLYENRVSRVKFIYFCLIISFRLFSKPRVSISLP